ncbi:hypothetical protein M011DRAFT_496486 [Sporormia fimetaria CBS 119925]|uniref:Ubiquitin-like-conjugating enzyme ATG10 n=1 Tax=Sporormia fimetaria CBS 119925 TaxID=1340428 RepID=A0A6A6V2K2_9PLEO|nr:hypothetical protein M011DRAFT_496486 [Sporormia fimetaria CBS 119925]
MTTATLTQFPHLTEFEFIDACSELAFRCSRSHKERHDWLSVEVLRRDSIPYLRITKQLTTPNSTSPDTIHIQSSSHEDVERSDIEISSTKGTLDHNTEDAEIEDEDSEILNRTLHTSERSCPIVEYDILLSPVYRVPVLYCSIKDPQFRFPPTMDSLYRYIIPPSFKPQAEQSGVMGGITITDHPVTNSPVFFIHPCQTAAVMEAVSDRKGDMAPFEYLMLWIGAICSCVGLRVPLEVARSMIPNE